MDLLISPKLFDEYFSSLLKFPKTEFQSDISLLINNPLNRFVISKDYLELIEANTTSNPIAAFAQPFLAEMINNQTLSVESDGSKTEEQVLKYIDAKYEIVANNKKKNQFFVLAYKKSNKHNSINLNNLNKPNRDFILFKTSCQHPQPLTLRYYDFTSNVEIEDAIKSIFSIQDGKDYMNILDRQANLKHNLFDFFKQDRVVHYYTAFDTFSGNSNNLKNTFKSVKVFCNKPAEIHERKLFSKNSVLELDDDFWNINVSKTTWKIELTYCPKVAGKLTQKTRPFKRMIFLT